MLPGQAVRVFVRRQIGEDTKTIWIHYHVQCARDMRVALENALTRHEAAGEAIDENAS